MACDIHAGHERFRKWRVFSASIFVMMLDYGFLYALGTIFVPLLDKFGENRGKTATIQSLFNGSASIASTFTGLFVARWGASRGLIVSSVLIPVGFFTSFFAESVVHLYVSLGILGGIGNSFIFVSSVVAVGQIFPKSQRSVALSVLMTCMGVASIVYPYLLDWLLGIYGLNGTFLVLSGLYLHTAIATIVFYYEIGVNPSTANNQSQKELLDDKETNAGVVNFVASSNDSHAKVKAGKLSREFANITENKKHVDDDMDNTETDKDANVHNTVVIAPKIRTNGFHKYDRTGATETNAYASVAKKELPRDRSTIKVGVVECDSHLRVKQDKISKDIHESEDVIDGNTGVNRHQGLCSVTFYLFSAASAMLIGTITGFVTIVDDVYTTKGLTKPESLSGFLTFNICNTVSRLAPGIASKLKVNCFVLPLLASIFGLTGQLIMLFFKTFVPLIVGSGLSGVALGAYASAVVSVTFGLLGPRQQAVGFGIIVTVNGICIACMGPVFGAMRDVSGDYTYVLMTTSTLNALCALIIVVILVTVFLYIRRLTSEEKDLSTTTSSYICIQ